MNPTSVVLIGLISGVAGALLFEALKLAYQRWQVSAARTAVAKSLPLLAGDLPPQPEQPAAPELRGALETSDSDPSPITRQPSAVTTPQGEETTKVAPPARPSITAPVNPAIGDGDLKPGTPDRRGAGKSAHGADGNARPRSPIMVYSQENSILTTLENSDEVEAVLQASRGRGSSPRKPHKPGGPSEPEQPAPESPAVPLPEVHMTLEEEAAAAPASMRLWAVYIALGVSIVLAIVFLFLALQPLLGL